MNTRASFLLTSLYTSFFICFNLFFFIDLIFCLVKNLFSNNWILFMKYFIRSIFSNLYFKYFKLLLTCNSLTGRYKTLIIWRHKTRIWTLTIAFYRSLRKVRTYYFSSCLFLVNFLLTSSKGF